MHPYPADLVIIALGHNDYSLPPMPHYGEFRDGLAALVDAARGQRRIAEAIAIVVAERMEW